MGLSQRPCVRVSTLSNMNISETSGPIAIKFNLKHYWGGGKAAFTFLGHLHRWGGVKPGPPSSLTRVIAVRSLDSRSFSC